MLASVASAICVRFADERFQKYVKYIAGLCVLALLAKPLYALVEELGERTDCIESGEQEPAADRSSYLEALGSQLSQSIGDRVARQYDIEREAIYVTLTLDTSDLSSIEIEAIELIINAECDEQAIEQALSDEFFCSVCVKEASSDDAD